MSEEKSVFKLELDDSTPKESDSWKQIIFTGAFQPPGDNPALVMSTGHIGTALWFKIIKYWSYRYYGL